MSQQSKPTMFECYIAGVAITKTTQEAKVTLAVDKSQMPLEVWAQLSEWHLNGDTQRIKVVAVSVEQVAENVKAYEKNIKADKEKPSHLSDGIPWRVINNPHFVEFLNETYGLGAQPEEGRSALKKYLQIKSTKEIGESEIEAIIAHFNMFLKKKEGNHAKTFPL